MKSKRGLRRGFTLIEVLVAMVVVSVGLAAFIPVLIQTVRGNSFGRATTRAATLSQDKLEELRTLRFIEVVPTGATTTTVVTATSSDSVDGFGRTWVVRSGGSSYGVDLAGIEVTTTWSDAQGTHTARAFTVRANDYAP